MLLILRQQRPEIMKAARLYTRVYLARSKDRREIGPLEDLSKIEIVNFTVPEFRLE